MQRRSFLQRFGLSASGMMLSRHIQAKSFPNYDPGVFRAERIEDILSVEGLLILRLNYTSDDPQHLTDHSGKIAVKGGKIKRIKSYFFHQEYDDFDPNVPGIKIQSDPGHEDVIVLWISGAEKNTVLSYPLGKSRKKISIGEILNENDHEATEGSAKVNISFLLDKEIGEIDPLDIGIKNDVQNFTFTIMADPQGGNPFAHEPVSTRMRIHNSFIDESVRLVNELDPKPVFNLVLGDIVDGQGQQEDFRAMNDMLSELKIPTLYELGNHETRYNSVFSPGYNMDAFNNYFAAQKEFNRMEKLLYSFNLGEWHFIVWPDPLRAKFWELHPHYIDWLEQDLEKYKDRPCFFFQHVPMHPIGIDPHITYAESVVVKRTLLDILGKYGNVKYIFSGHVHIPMKAAVKTAVEYKGMKMINLPAAGYRPRAFGEEDFNGGPCQGIAIIEVVGAAAEVKFKTVVNEMFTFPSPPLFHEKDFPLWLKYKWELAQEGGLKNGSVRDGLKHWHKRFIYMEDDNPSNICESLTDENGKSFVSLFCRPRGFSTPGQDRLPQSINRICQVTEHPKGKIPLIRLSHFLDPDYFEEESPAGTYIWLEGFERGLKRLNVVYSTNHIYWHLGGEESQLRTVLPVHLEITRPPGEWRTLILNPIDDFKRFTEMEETYPERMDTFAITLGVWTINEGYGNACGTRYSDIELEYDDPATSPPVRSTIDGEEIKQKEQKFLWWRGVSQVAGEHMSIVEDLNKYLK